MRALCYESIGAGLRLIQAPEPECPADGVVVAVRATGVCRSDWHAWRGHDPVHTPHIPGHEFAGVILRTGSLVRRWAPGARVTVPFVCGCGDCSYCHQGDAQICPDQTQPGFTGLGSFADQVAVHAADTNLVEIPNEVDDVAAAALGCRVPTAFRALTAHGSVRQGEWVAVHGCGGVGLSAVLVGTALGAQVVGVDPRPAAVERAQELGAAAGVVATDAGKTPDAVRQLTGGGAHVSVDAIGEPDVSAASVRCLRRGGRHVQVGLLLGESAMTAYAMDLVVSHELTLAGSHGMAAGDYPPLFDLVASKALDPARLVGRVLPLSQAEGVLAELDDPAPTQVGITVVTPDTVVMPGTVRSPGQQSPTD